MKQNLKSSPDDNYISFVNMHGQLIKYDIPYRCAQCQKCLVANFGRCPWGGPYDANFMAYRAAI